MKKQKSLTFFIILILLLILYPVFFYKDIGDYLNNNCYGIEEPILKKFCFAKKHELEYVKCQAYEFSADNDKCIHNAFKTLGKSKNVDFWPGVLRWFLPPIFLLLLVIRFKRFKKKKALNKLKQKLESEKRKIDRIQREKK